MTQAQLNKARAMRMVGLTIREIVAQTGLTYFEVRDNTTPPAKRDVETVEVVSKRLLSKVPKWFKGTDAEWRHLVEMNFGVVGK